MFQKCAHYLDWGVPTAWIVDPEQRKAYLMTRAVPQPVTLFASDALTAEPGLVLALNELFAQLDKFAS